MNEVQMWGPGGMQGAKERFQREQHLKQKLEDERLGKLRRHRKQKNIRKLKYANYY